MTVFVSAITHLHMMFPLITILQSLSFLKIHTVMFMYQCRHLQQSYCECTRNRRHTQVLALIKFCESKLRFWVTLRSPVNKYWELFLLFLSFEPMFVVKRPIREHFAHMEIASLTVESCQMLAYARHIKTFVVSKLLWHGASVFAVSPKAPLCYSRHLRRAKGINDVFQPRHRD